MIYLRFIFILLTTFGTMGAAWTANAATLLSNPPMHFAQAKKILPRIFKGVEETFYCGCRYSEKTIDLASCGYQVRKNAERAQKLEWEHIVPAHAFGHTLRCWQDGGRKACRTDEAFNRMEGDIVNLVPSIGEVNGDRSNFSFSVWTNQPNGMYGQCATMVDFKNKLVQPRPEVRGVIARTYFYMHETYGLPLSNADKNLFCAWAKTLPISAWEIERDRRIQQFQAGNRFVQDPNAIETICKRS